MKQDFLPSPSRNDGRQALEPIDFHGTFRKKFRGFASLLLVIAMLLASFALGGMAQAGGWMGLFQKEEDSAMPVDNSSVKEESPAVFEQPKEQNEKTDSADTPTFLNLSLYEPDLTAALEKEVKLQKSVQGAPTVLVLHTHAREAYGDSGELFSDDKRVTVTEVGKAFVQELRENGVSVIHCTVLHDDPTQLGAYARAEESIRFFLQQYPTIQCVIDLHRGEDAKDPSVEFSVGSDFGNSEDGYFSNLSLSLQLAEKLLTDEKREEDTRVTLCSSSLNQEYSVYALSVKIGNVGKSVAEAKEIAQNTARVFADFFE